MHYFILLTVEGNVLLTSSLEGRRFACDGELITFTCQVVGSSSFQWNSPRIASNPIIFLSGDPTGVPTPRQPFLATLTSVLGSGFDANFTSTLQVNASRMFSQAGTTVQCRNQQQNSEQSNFTAAG